MSYYTEIECRFDLDRPDLKAVVERMRVYLEENAERYPAHEEIFKALKRSFVKGRNACKGIDSEHIDAIMPHVSAGFPGVLFYVRGVGEEFPDAWLRVFRDGQTIFLAGPFEDEADAALG